MGRRGSADEFQDGGGAVGEEDADNEDAGVVGGRIDLHRRGLEVLGDGEAAAGNVVELGGADIDGGGKMKHCAVKGGGQAAIGFGIVVNRRSIGAGKGNDVEILPLRQFLIIISLTDADKQGHLRLVDTFPRQAF